MSVIVKDVSGRAFLAFDDFQKQLLDEIQHRFGSNQTAIQHGQLLYYPELSKKQSILPFWCRSAYIDPISISFSSIGEAAKALKGIQRNWAPYQFTQFRRAALIQEKLPYINLKEREFPFSIPKSPMGIWTMLDENTILASATTSSYLPAGFIQLKEDRENPPSRAYLKLQEALIHFESFFGKTPQAGESCFDAGACPGGWTWVLTQLGAKVFAIDRSPLDERLMQHPLVRFMSHDAFTLKPQEIGPFDWVFSDVICYPVRLYEWIQGWLESGLCKNMICTIKLQGNTDWPLLDQFAAIPGSRVLHLNYNKHELTWLYCQDAHEKDGLCQQNQ